MNAVLEINAEAVIHNITYFKSKLHSTTKIVAVVKAFGYGSDSVLLAQILQKKSVDYLAVAYTDEGVSLRNAGISLPIIVLHPQKDNLKTLVDYSLEPNIYSNFILCEFLTVIKQTKNKDYPIHLKFNTGLNRLGFGENDVASVIDIINKEASVMIATIFSHLAESDEIVDETFTLKQISIFKNIQKTALSLLNYAPIFHLSNTSGIINYPDAEFDMVRLGIGMLGFDNANNENLQNALTLKSVISQIHHLNKGDSVGYNRAFLSDKKIKIATIAIGHADGISRKLGNGNGYVIINNRKAKIVGNVCMDMLMIDITAIDCNEGDEVVLFNSQQMIENMAVKINTIPYELLTLISQRVKRVRI
ncbi:MAG: alanine racemase [Flavobacteriaceae bacterium]